MSWLGVSALTFSSSSREVSPSHIPLSLQGLTSFHMDFSHFWVNLLLLAALGKLKNERPPCYVTNLDFFNINIIIIVFQKLQPWI